MKKIIYLSLYILLFSFSANATTPLWEWKNNFNGSVAAIDYHNDYLYTVGTFSDSAFIFGNANIVNHGNKDVVIAKWDTLGNLIWATSIWGTAYDTAIGIKVNANNEIVVVGHSSSASLNVSGNILNSNGGSDIFNAKYDLNGVYINASMYGTAANETARDMCTDYLNNTYIVSNDRVAGYNGAGVFLWQQIITAEEIDYSNFDSTIVVSGHFHPSLTLGNFTINVVLANNPNAPDIFAAKISPAGVPIWLKNVTGTHAYDATYKIAISELNGRIYLAKTSYWQLNGPAESLHEYSSAGINIPNQGLAETGIMFHKSMSIVDSFLIVSGGDIWNSNLGLTILNVNADGGPPVKSYYLGSYNNFNYPEGYPLCHYYKNLDAIYTMSFDIVHHNKLGKIGVFLVLSASPSYQNIAACENHIITLSGNSIGGMAPFTYSWAPATGLNNTNTNTVNFTAATNISYTLTVTDNIGQIVKDTFNVMVYPNSSSLTNISICANQTPYLWNGQNFDSTGLYTVNLTNMYGCDSVASLNLNVSPCIVCVPDFTINYSPFYNSLTESQSWIITSGTVLIEAGNQVKLDAHQTSYVMINPGFKAEHGSVFVAQAYNGCTAGAPQLPQIGKAFIEDPFAAKEIVLYPNPTSGMIHIKHDEKLSDIQVFDMVGKLVINQKCAGETETNIDLGNLPNGVYHVKAAGYHSIKVVKNN